jgi:malonate-semialdehyde dehydrogenase (acetylating)/methylmalonate-semialdehyde dehydrogenase
MTERLRHWRDGRAWEGSSERRGGITNPATGETILEVAFASAQDVGSVVENARTAAQDWSRQSLARRSDVLFAFRDLLNRHRDELAAVVTREHGKVLDDARGEVGRGLEVVEYACGIQELLKGQASDGVSTGVDVLTRRQPLGVVAGITPFNFPAMVPLWMFPIAIACGNAFVLKPSERDPSVSVRLAELLQEAGLPDGVMNVVHGDRQTVEALLEHPDVRAISFVGSTPVARSIYARATVAGKRVQALGGAKNHMVVLPDADLEEAALAAVSAGYGSAGQRCMAISVVVAVEPVADALVERIARHTRELVVADGTTGLGPLITPAAKERVLGLVESGVREGAKLVCDGRTDVPEGNGFFVGPCLFDHVDPGMQIYREEIFGPVLAVIRARSFDDALRLVNSNPYGNGAALFTRDGGVAREFVERVEAGMVGINVPIPVPVASHSFGGWSDSLFGDTHVYGPEGVRFYTRAKAVTTRWSPVVADRPELGFPGRR